MARAPNEKLNKALSLYQKGYKLVDIAKELDIPVGTIRRIDINGVAMKETTRVQRCKKRNKIDATLQMIYLG